MKRQEKKLGLNEVLVQSFITTLDRDEQKQIAGGSGAEYRGTELIVFCRA